MKEKSVVVCSKSKYAQFMCKLSLFLQLLSRKYSPQFCWAFHTLLCHIRSDCHNKLNQWSKHKRIIKLKLSLQLLYYYSLKISRMAAEKASQRICATKENPPSRIGSIKTNSSRQTTKAAATAQTYICKSSLVAIKSRTATYWQQVFSALVRHGIGYGRYMISSDHPHSFLATTHLPSTDTSTSQ